MRGGREDRKGVGRGEEEEERGTGDRHRDRGRQRQGEYIVYTAFFIKNSYVYSVFLDVDIH